MPDIAESPLYLEGSPEELSRKISLIVREILAGKTNNIIDFTLLPDETQTVIERDRVNIDTRVVLMPKSASAALALSTLWIGTTRGKITVHHDSTADTDRTFGAVLVG